MKMGTETDKIIMRAPKRLFHAWLQGTPYNASGRASHEGAFASADRSQSRISPSEPP
jgi:hypothetical protein